MKMNRLMLNKIFFALSIPIMFGISSCVEFKTATLYNSTEPATILEKPKSISQVVEPEIYSDSPKDMWGLEKDVCQDVQITKEVVYEGDEAISLTWNKGNEGCKWAGIGIGWDGYSGKDLTQIMEYGAIQFYVRSKEGRMFGLPIVLTLEDYSGGMGFCYTGNKFFERSSIDEEWQKVVVPLSAFDLETENLDVSNIKQLQLELQQSGNIYMDEIELVFYEPEEIEPWMVEEKLPDPTALPITIFDNSFINNNSFGLMKDQCRTIALTDTEAESRGKIIHATWDGSKDCKYLEFGASWNKWHPVNLSANFKNVALQFDMKSTSTFPDINFGLEDYDRAICKVKITEAQAGKSVGQDWATYTVSFSDLKGGFDYSRVKHLFFSMEGSGEVFIDNIKLTEFPQ